MPTLSEEEFKKMAEQLAEQMQKQPIQLTPLDDRKRQAADLIENMRWVGLRDRLDDIRDLLYVNANLNSAIIELLMTMGTPMTEDDRRERFVNERTEANNILHKMHLRNDKAKKHIKNLMAELDALMHSN